LPPRYIIHIGPMKTASTYLQECLKATQDELAAQGICYPQEFISTKNKFQHLPIFFALQRRRQEVLRPMFAKVNEQGYHTVVLSCEHFHFLQPDAFRAWRDVTGATDFEIVYTARRWSDRIGSLWNHAVFMGGTQSLPEFYLSLLAGNPISYYPKWMQDAKSAADLDYSITWSSLGEIFGHAALRIFPYSVIMDRGEDVFEAFCKYVLGLPAAPPTELSGQLRWASMSPAMQEIARVLNERHLTSSGRRGSAMAMKLQRKRNPLPLKMLEDAIEAEMEKLVIDDRFAPFDQPFENMNRYLDCVVGADLLFKRGAKAVRYVRPGYMLHDGVREEFNKIYGMILESLKDEDDEAA
jgi:hypothetical protein